MVRPRWFQSSAAASRFPVRIVVVGISIRRRSRAANRCSRAAIRVMVVAARIRCRGSRRGGVRGGWRDVWAAVKWRWWSLRRRVADLEQRIAALEAGRPVIVQVGGRSGGPGRR